MDLIKCRKCTQSVWANQRVCPNCGTPLSPARVLWSFARGEGKGEVIGALLLVGGMGVGFLGHDQVGGIVASIGVAVFFAGRFARRVKAGLYSRGRRK
ncbi:MAG: hypothetical protein EPN72_00790 [Nevskiaceae bacterium]|nr:MAG: hypothetical protein EPN63_11540 [Nevskiaceae bacterium]TBR74597.1 MAG: hypothetical protein EPN72_00790 [Nevskiaceae bacterium]